MGRGKIGQGAIRAKGGFLLSRGLIRGKGRFIALQNAADNAGAWKEILSGVACSVESFRARAGFGIVIAKNLG